MTDRDRLIELIDTAFIKSDDNFGMPNVNQVADYLLAKGVIVPPCKVGDSVWINLICGLKEDNSPIFEMKQGRVYKIEVDNTKDTIWIGADFGVLHCCRPYTDFCFTKEEAEAKLRGLQNEMQLQ